MPNVAALSYTPPRSCDIVLTAAFDAQSGGQADFGSSVSYRFDCVQGSTVQSSPSRPVGSARLRYSTEWRVPVLAGVACALYLVVTTGTGNITLWNIEFKAEVIKA